MTKYLWYVMLNASDGRQCERSEIPDGMVEAMRPLLAKGGLKQNVIPGLNLMITTFGTALQATVQDSHGILAAFTVAVRDRGAAEHWRALHQDTTAKLDTDPLKVPKAPWVGLALETRAGDYPRALIHTIIALAKACAWTWVEMRSRADA